MKYKAIALAVAGTAFLAAPAFAHHSFAMFDATKTVTLKGTVKEFEWTNPHSWLRVMVMDDTGTPRQWALEMGSPGQQSRVGWKADSVKPGDQVTVEMHPLKDGSRGGQFLSVELPNGQHLGNGGRKNNAEGD
jgi:hypothetical protein